MERVSIADWFRPEVPVDIAYDPALNDDVAWVVKLVDNVHRLPPFRLIKCSPRRFGDEEFETEYQGCEVRFRNDLLPSHGVEGHFVPEDKRSPAEAGFSLIELQPPAVRGTKFARLYLLHETAHLVWIDGIERLGRQTGTRLDFMLRWRHFRFQQAKLGFERDLARNNKFRRIVNIARDVKRLNAEQSSEASRRLSVDAAYEASRQEWIARIYVFMIMRTNPKTLKLWQETFGREGVQFGPGRPMESVYPPLNEMNHLATKLLKVFREAGLTG